MDRRFFWLLAAGFCLGLSSIACALTPEQIKPLGEDDFDAKAEALDQVIAAGDEAAQRSLDALTAEQLYANKAVQILISHGDSYHDALTDEQMAAKADDPQAIG